MVEIDERDGLARQNKDVLNLDTLATDTPDPKKYNQRNK